MPVKRSNLVLASLMALPSAAFALGFGDLRLLSSLNAPLDAEIELVDVTPEEMQSLKAQIASREMFARYGLDWPVYLSTVQVKVIRGPEGREYLKLKSTEAITEPFITLLVEVNWARGRSVREYTMLLDPPVYTPGQSAANSAPVAAPSTGVGPREGSIARTDVPAAQDTSSISPVAPSDAPASASPPPATSAPSRSTGSMPSAEAGSTHIVKQGETLSSVASSTSGGGPNSAQTRSWMLAIYQANPRAFDKNMNLMRSGAVLRIPDSADVSAISPSEANGEIRRQYAAWRSTTPATGASSGAEPGRLRLVTPTGAEPGGGNAAADTENKALRGRVKDLETQLGDSKRLLEMRNVELAQLQSRLESASKAASGSAAQPAPPPAPPVAATTPPAAEAPPVEQPPAAQAEAPATAPPPAQEPAPAAEPTPTPSAERTHRPTPAGAQAESGGLFDTLKDYWWALTIVAVALLGFFGMRAWRSRRQSEFDDSLGRLAVAGANAMDRGFAAGGDTSPVRPLTAATDDGAFLVEETGSHERPRFGTGGGSPAAAAARHVSTEDTISSDTAINLDQGDPLAEADFHMAYGLYDQAADLIRIAISREPNRRDLKLKLLEVFFVWGNKEQFLHSARELADTRDQAAPGEWEKIVIMGKQLAPDDLLFSGGGAISGATAGGVDLDLEGGESRVDFDLLGEPIPGHGDEVDLDIGSALGDETEEATGSTDRTFGFDTTVNRDATGTTRQMTQKISREPQPLMPEFGSESEGPTVEQPQLASTDNPTIRQKVAMALKQGHSAEQTAELAIDDLGLDLGALDTVDQPGLGAGSDAPTLVAGMDERSRKIIEEAQRRASNEEHDTAATAAWRMDDSDLHAVLGNNADGHEEEENVEFDSSSTARLAALSGREVDFDLGDVDADGVGEADADGMHHHHARGGNGLDLDVGTATVPDTAFTATQKLASDDLALPDLEPVTMSEVGTKLDLARAYMDMGDPEGARNILEEVMHEGSVAQKQEAQRLLESLPG